MIFLLWLNLATAAESFDLPKSLAPPLLSEVAPFVFTPTDFEIEDWEVRWEGAPIPGVKVRLGRESLEWIRTRKYFVLPRARLIISGDGEAGMVRNGGYVQAMSVRKGKARAGLPVALISGPRNAIHLQVVRGGQVLKGTLVIRFAPKDGRGGVVLRDTSCSKYGVGVPKNKIPKNSWMYVTCRMPRVEGDRYGMASLEMLVFWDNVGQSMTFDGMPVQSSGDSLWALRLKHSPGKVRLGAGGGEATLQYFIPKELHDAFLGLGVGPYHYLYKEVDTDINTIAPVITLYGSYFMSESMRFVIFDATSIHRKFYSDLGGYFLIQQAKALDERFTINLLLGAKTILFTHGDSLKLSFSAPQGFELVFQDAFKRGYKASAGGFLYPTINETTYYNLWVRYGPPSFFIEINYILWREPVGDDESVFSRSFGLTAGFPLATFL